MSGDPRGEPPAGFVWRSSPAWLDMCGVTDPEARERALRQTLPAPKRRPERTARAEWSQAALDAQPLKRAQARARARHQQQIATVKARAAAPLRPATITEPVANPTEPTLF